MGQLDRDPALGPSLEADRKLRLEGQGAWVDPRAEVSDPKTALGSQEVGLIVKLGRPSSRLMLLTSRGMPSMIWGRGSLTAWILAVSGSTYRATLVVTTPRSKGPATAGVITTMLRGAPLYGPAR